MRRLFIAFFVWFAGIACAYPHQSETVLSTCKVFPEFSVDQVRYHTDGPEVYGVFFYDLNYIERQHVLILIVDDNGQPTYQKEIDRNQPKSQHFEISERVGNANNVAKDVQAYLKSQTIYFCS